MATTPTFGWETPDDTDYVQQGYAAIDTLGNDIDITLNVVTGSTGSGDVPKQALNLITSQTVGTAVSSVTVSNVFSSRFDTYKIQYSGGVASTLVDINFRLGSISTGYYGTIIYSTYTAGSPNVVNTNNGANYPYVGYGTTNSTYANFEIVAPYLPKPTLFGGFYASATTSGTFNAQESSTTQHTSFTLSVASGTLTGGKIRVYGYRND